MAVVGERIRPRAADALAVVLLQAREIAVGNGNQLLARPAMLFGPPPGLKELASIAVMRPSSMRRRTLISTRVKRGRIGLERQP
jgi:hypothetical protein